MAPGEPTLFSSPLTEPLAARMRPRTLDEYVGQGRILGPGRLLRRAIEADRLSSVILHGPPGTGKTTLARVIAGSTRARFVAINAVLGGVKDIRDAVADAEALRRIGGRTILFVDEVHRFNKAQQDALLPWVESGTVTLIGATTENPFFAVNAALVSRSRIFALEGLTDDDLRAVARQALSDPERGYGRARIDVDEAALAHLIDVAAGDARSLLNALELAVETTDPAADGVKRITLPIAEESIQRRAVLYDKEGDAHHDTISAFIKSVRGSDPDAALYWLARMIVAGEDPRFILRRLVILASEDVGLADPSALADTIAALQAFEFVGLPEGRYPLAQATLRLATAAKSNSTMGLFDAQAAVEREAGDVPNHLRDPNRDGAAFGHGAGYLYPHAYRDHWVAQNYLPEALRGRIFYQPSDRGAERAVAERVARHREAQLAAMFEPHALEAGARAAGSGEAGARDGWWDRSFGAVGERLARIRDAMIDLARIEPHHVVLDAAARAGLLTWEAVRRTPTGWVWAIVDDEREAEALAHLARPLDELRRPKVLIAGAGGAAAAVRGADAAQRFDVIVARQIGAAALAPLAALLAPGGRIVAAEIDASRSQRLSELTHADAEPGLLARWRAAEAALYPDAAWDEARWREVATASGLAWVAQRDLIVDEPQRIAAAAQTRWFGDDDRSGSYARALATDLSGAEVAAVIGALRRRLATATPWRTTVSLALLAAAPAA